MTRKTKSVQVHPRLPTIPEFPESLSNTLVSDHIIKDTSVSLPLPRIHYDDDDDIPACPSNFEAPPEEQEEDETYVDFTDLAPVPVPKVSVEHKSSSSIQDKVSYIRITLTNACLQQEYLKAGVTPLTMIQIGNHEVFISADKAQGEKLVREFCGLVWLYKHRKHDTMQTVCSYISVQKFIALKYGMSMIELYQNPMRIRESIQAQKLYMSIGGDQTMADESNEISKLLKQAHAVDVEIFTDQFGVVCLPTEEEMELFLSKAKVVVGGFENNIYQRSQFA